MSHGKKDLGAEIEVQRRSLTLGKCFCIVFVASFLCYFNTLDAKFVYDDNRCILTNQDLLSSTPLTNIFFDDFWGTPLSHSGSHKSYRPLCILSFRLNYMFGGLEPQGYHLVNNILHSIVSCLFVYLCYKFFEDVWITLIGGLLFGFHPIHTEAVAGLVGRADIGAAAFFLSSLILYIHATKDVSNISYFGIMSSLVGFACSMYTKEQGFTVLGVLIAYEILFVSKCNLAYPKLALHNLIFTKGIHRITIVLLFGTISLYMRFLIMGNSLPDFSPADNPAANESNGMIRTLTFFYLPFCNFWLLLYPANLSYDYSLTNVPLVENLFSLEVFLSFMLYAFLFSCGLFYLYYFRKYFNANAYQTTHKSHKKQQQSKQRLSKKINAVRPDIHHFKNENDISNINNRDSDTRWTFNVMVLGFAMLILPFLPATNLFFYVGFIVAERILYMPSIGYCFLVTNGINLLMKKYKERRHHILGLVAVVLILFALKTFNRNYVWKDEETLYRSGLATSPAKSYGNLANILIKQNKLREAEEAYRTALKFRYNMADTHYNLGILLQNQKRYDEAIQCYNDAIKYRPRLAAAHLNLGVTLTMLNRNEDALEVLRNGAEISDHGLKDPLLHVKSLTSIRYNMGKVLYELHRYEEAIEVFLDAIKRMPDSYEPHSLYNMLGQCYTALKNPMFAEPWYIRALNEKPDHVPALLTCARHYHESHLEGSWEHSEEHLRKALSLEPKRMETYLMYAGFLQERQQYRAALSVLENSLKVETNNVQVLALMSTVHRKTMDRYRQFKFAETTWDMKDYDEAMKYQLLAVQANPQDYSTLINLGALYHMAGNLKEAEKVYTKALSKDPTNEILLTNIQKLKRAMKV